MRPRRDRSGGWGSRTLLSLTLAAASGSHLACAPLTERTDVGVPGRAHLAYVAGWKHKERAWSPGEEETLIGFVDADRRLAAIPAWIVGKLLVGTADAPDLATDPDADSAGTAEFCVGLRQYVQVGRGELFASAGVALLAAGVTGYREETADAYSVADETTLGGWVDAGIVAPLTPAFAIGAVLHHSTGPELELEGADLQPGGTSLLVTLGWRR